LFATRLTDPGFLERLFEHQDRQSRRSESRSRVERLQAQLEALGQKRQRILDLYVDGDITKEERGRRLEQMESELVKTREMLAHELPPQTLSVEAVAQIFSPFLEWKFLERMHKRQLLSAIGPEIRTANYVVHGMSMTLAPDIDVDSPVRMGRYRLRAPPCR
jgi:hypothetical protein